MVIVRQYILMLQATSYRQLYAPRSPTNKQGLIFVLPNPVIYQQNNLTNITLPRSSSISESNSFDSTSRLKLTTKKRKKRRQRNLSQFDMKGDIKYPSINQQKSVLEQNLYKKFISKTKPNIQYTQEARAENEKSSPTNVKLRKLNLVILSKKEEMKKTTQSKEKEIQQKRERQRSLDHSFLTKQNGVVLPHFGRSRSSFYKPNSREYNTLAFLSKTIFSQIQSHYIARFPRQKPVEPMELGITKVKIVNKNSKGKKRKLHIDNQNESTYFSIKSNIQERKNSLKKSWYDRKNQAKRKPTQLKGWDEDYQDQNYNNIILQQ